MSKRHMAYRQFGVQNLGEENTLTATFWCIFLCICTCNAQIQALNSLARMMASAISAKRLLLLIAMLRIRL